MLELQWLVWAAKCSALSILSPVRSWCGVQVRCMYRQLGLGCKGRGGGGGGGLGWDKGSPISSTVTSRVN